MFFGPWRVESFLLQVRKKRGSLWSAEKTQGWRRPWRLPNLQMKTEVRERHLSPATDRVQASMHPLWHSARDSVESENRVLSGEGGTGIFILMQSTPGAAPHIAICLREENLKSCEGASRRFLDFGYRKCLLCGQVVAQRSTWFTEGLSRSFLPSLSQNVAEGPLVVKASQCIILASGSQEISFWGKRCSVMILFHLGKQGNNNS